MTVFAEEIAGRDLTLADAADWDTPSTHPLPNTDNATHANAGAAEATFSDPTGLFQIPYGTSDFTVELWVYYTADNAGLNRWFFGRFGASGTRAWEVRQPGDTSRHVRFAIIGSDGTTVLADREVLADLDAWTHCVFTFKSSLGAAPVAGRTLNAYKNGSIDGTSTVGSGVTMTPPTLTSPKMTVGHPGSAATLAEFAKVAIYHRELTSGEVLDHYEAMTT